MKSETNKHSEEFTEIAQRIPSSYSDFITYGLLAFLILAIILGFVIEVPDMVFSEVRVSSLNAPIILKAQSNGKIHIVKDRNIEHCNKGEYIAIIENSANYNDIQWLKNQLETLDIESLTDSSEVLCKKMLLGDIGVNYYSFKNAYLKVKLLQDSNNIHSLSVKSLIQQNEANNLCVVEKEKLLEVYILEEKIKKLRIESDSKLLDKGAITQTDYDQNHIIYLEGKSRVLSMQIEIDQMKQNSHQLVFKISQTSKEYETSRIEAINALYDSYNQLLIQLRNWEKSYAIVAPDECNIEYADVIVDGNFVSIGDPLYNVIFGKSNYFGIMVLPSDGAGNVHIGDSVNLKMNPYPFQDYGYLRGCVTSISKNSMNKNYLAYVELPFGLISNNGYELVFAETMYGNAEIISGKRCLIVKLINQFKYLMSPRKQFDLDEKKDIDEIQEEQKSKF